MQKYATVALGRSLSELPETIHYPQATNMRDAGGKLSENSVYYLRLLNVGTYQLIETQI